MKVRLLKILDATAGFFLCWTAGWWLHIRRRNIPGSAPVPAEVRRILVIRPGGLGDMVLLQPMLLRLRQQFPAAAIDLVCERRNQDIPAMAGHGARVLPYDAHPFQLVRELRKNPYDIAVDTEQFHYFSAIMALLSGAPVRIGFKINPGRNTIYTHLVNYDLEGYEAGEFMRLLAPLGIKEAAGLPMRWTGLSEHGQLMNGTSLSPDAARRSASTSPHIVIHIGTGSRYKRWGTEKFASLVTQLSDLRPQPSALRPLPSPLCLVGGRQDRDEARAIARQAGVEGVRVLAGDLTIRETASLIAQAGLFIGGDSGLAHLAVALGTPTVVLFGPSDHRKWGVEGPRNAIVRRDLACSPCFIFGYHKFCHSISCMTGITVTEVLNACRKIDGIVL